MSDAEIGTSITLLTCAECGQTYDVVEDPALPEAARSMKAALEAHKAGWYAAGGPILCPDCAAQTKH